MSAIQDFAAATALPPELVLKHWQGGSERNFEARYSRPWLTPESTIFAIGSCFAVNFVRWLVEQGVRTPIPSWGFHYNPMTVYEEIRQAAGGSPDALTWELCSEAGTRYVDARRHPVSADSLDALQQRQAQIVAQSRACFAAADGIIITLGLSEVWEQRVHGHFRVINRIPDPAIVSKAEFRSRFLSLDEIVEQLRQLVDLIRRVKGAAIPIVFTVSPIPLKASAADMDIQSANLRSKALLIAAVHAFLEEDTVPSRASYFPAYELVAGGPRPEAMWQRDQRHLQAFVINRVCLEFCRLYAVAPQQFASNPHFRVPLV